MTLAPLLWMTLAAAPPCPAVADAGALGVADLGWLAGSWTGPDGATAVEETWLAPSGGTMLAVHRDVDDGRTTGFEFLRIEETAGTLVYRPMPDGRPPTDFVRVAQGPSCVVFERAEDRFPKRVLYWREGETLVARIEGTRGGTAAARTWRWTRTR